MTTTRNRDETTLPARLLPQFSAAQVDRIAGVTREDWSKAAIASDAAYGAALDRVLVEMKALRRLMLIGFGALVVLLVALALGVAALAISFDRRIDNIEKRLP